MNNRNLTSHLLIAIFAIFVGAQLVEGCLMVPHWKSMSSSEFYSFYGSFGPGIGQFYTILTVIAGLITIGIAIQQWLNKSNGRYWALAAAILMIICIGMFYVYFKGANELFYAGELSPDALRAELDIWLTWHNVRVVMELLALGFLCVAVSKD